MKPHIHRYSRLLTQTLDAFDWSAVEDLGTLLEAIWLNDKQLFICGNGGSAANAIHMANDFIYGLYPEGKGIKTHALAANQSILSCFGNDLGYDSIFSGQLKVLAGAGDLLLVLSGSGNSSNIIKALEMAKDLGVQTAGILGYSGGAAKDLLDIPIHFPVDDMQIAEDLQMIVAHMLVQYLRK